MGKGTGILPDRSACTFSLSSEEVSVGSANKSPKTMAREKWFFACNFDSFSKTAGNCPCTEPVMILGES